MLSRLNLMFSIIFLLWTSASGKLYTFEGYWPVEIEKCDNTKDDSRDKIYNVGTLDLANLSFDDLKKKTHVTVEGEIKLRLDVTGPTELKELLLDRVVKKKKSINYSAKRKLEAYNDWGSQVAVLEISLTIQKSGKITLRNYVYAGSWGTHHCSQAESVIRSFKIDV